MYLPPQQAVGQRVVLNAPDISGIPLPPVTNTSAFYYCKFEPDSSRRLIKRLSLIGPAYSRMLMYIGMQFIDFCPRGDFNDGEWPEGIPLPQGSILTLIWYIGSANGAIPYNGTPIPIATLFCTDEEW